MSRIYFSAISSTTANRIDSEHTQHYKRLLPVCETEILRVTVPGRVAQSVTCLATDACLTADPGVASLIPVRSHTFVEIIH